MITYEVKISVDLGAVVPQVGALANQLNTDLAKAGWDEKLMVRGRLITCTITNDHDLTEDQKAKVKKTIVEEFSRQAPAWSAKIESFRRKPGNVQQQVA